MLTAALQLNTATLEALWKVCKALLYLYSAGAKSVRPVRKSFYIQLLPASQSGSPCVLKIAQAGVWCVAAPGSRVWSLARRLRPGQKGRLNKN